MSQFAVWYYVVVLKEKIMHENNFARLETDTNGSKKHWGKFE